MRRPEGRAAPAWIRRPAGVAILVAMAVLAGCDGARIGAPPDPTPVESLPAAFPVAEIVTSRATITGTLGTYTMDGSGSDAPWLPFASLPSVTSGPDEMLTIRFADGATIGDASVTIAAAEDLSGSNPRGVDDTVLAADETTLSIGPVPRGRWVLAIRLFRADGRGDGLTYWAITVG